MDTELYLKTRPGFRNPTDFDFNSVLEENWSVIREELDKILDDKVWTPFFGKDLVEGEWGFYWFHSPGGKDKKNCARCPKTAALLAKFPQIKYANFAALGGRSVLPPHKGVPGLLRAHFVVKTEENKARWTAAEETKISRQGKMEVFEDGHRHGAWNDSAHIRVTLMMSLTGPELTPEESEEIYRSHDNRYGFLYVIERYVRTYDERFQNFYFKLIFPILRPFGEPANKIISYMKPIFILFMSTWATKKRITRTRAD